MGITDFFRAVLFLPKQETKKVSKPRSARKPKARTAKKKAVVSNEMQVEVDVLTKSLNDVREQLAGLETDTRRSVKQLNHSFEDLSGDVNRNKRKLSSLEDSLEEVQRKPASVSLQQLDRPTIKPVALPALPPAIRVSEPSPVDVENITPKLKEILNVIAQGNDTPHGYGLRDISKMLDKNYNTVRNQVKTIASSYDLLERFDDSDGIARFKIKPGVQFLTTHN